MLSIAVKVSLWPYLQEVHMVSPLLLLQTMLNLEQRMDKPTSICDFLTLKVTGVSET